MYERKNRLIAGVAGGVAGGVVMALALTATQRLGMTRAPKSQKMAYGLAQKLLMRTPWGKRKQNKRMGAFILSSALLGGLYGGLRSSVKLPRMAVGPVFGLMTMGLDRLGLANTVSQTPGPWGIQTQGLPSRLLTHAAYGMVADMVTERVSEFLS